MKQALSALLLILVGVMWDFLKRWWAMRVFHGLYWLTVGLFFAWWALRMQRLAESCKECAERYLTKLDHL